MGEVKLSNKSKLCAKASLRGNTSHALCAGYVDEAIANEPTKNLIIARWGEIHLKGANRGFFLNALKKNLQAATGADVKIQDSRILITDFDDLQETVRATANTFGVVSVSPAVEVESVPAAILDYVKSLEINGTFKVEVNRANKTFPHRSFEFAAIAGGVIAVATGAPVDIHNPQTVVSIDIRERTFIYSTVVDGVGGLPVGTAGRALCLLSGGIDSPVAAYLAAKRGLAVDCIHFASPPYTSDFALEKVKDLVHELTQFCSTASLRYGTRAAERAGSRADEAIPNGPALYIVPFTEIQEAIRKNCPSEFMITIMRRFMIRIAERVGLNTSLRGATGDEAISNGPTNNFKYDCIITGENLSQVASQTVAGIASNNCCARVLPILRPLITYDKSEIITLARKIGTYDTSCKPYPDCCTVFVPKHPSITPNLKKVETSEAKLDVEVLINNALNKVVNS